MPLFNKAQYVRRAVESVIAQSCTDFELIVIDDGSTDNGPSIVEDIPDSRIRLIKQQNAGVSAARNRGIEEAKGKWIAFLDADDFWVKEYLTRQIELLERNPDLMWSAANYFIDTGLPEWKEALFNIELTESRMNGKDYFDNYFHARSSLAINAWTGAIIVRKDVFDKAGMFVVNTSHGEDTDMWFRIAFHWPQIGYITEPLAVYDATVQGSLADADAALAEMQVRIFLLADMAKKHNCYDDVKPCLTQLLQNEISILFQRKRYFEIRTLMLTHSDYLPKRYRTEINLCTMYPSLIGLFNTYKKIKRLFAPK